MGHVASLRLRAAGQPETQESWPALRVRKMPRRGRRGTPCSRRDRQVSSSCVGRRGAGNASIERWLGWSLDAGDSSEEKAVSETRRMLIYASCVVVHRVGASDFRTCSLRFADASKQMIARSACDARDKAEPAVGTAKDYAGGGTQHESIHSTCTRIRSPNALPRGWRRLLRGKRA